MFSITQRIIISIGIVLVLISGLFLPYEGEYVRDGDVFKKYMGYYFLFNPPTDRHVQLAFYGEMERYNKLNVNRYFNSHIISSIFWIKISVIVLVTFGLVILLLSENNNAVKSEIKDAAFSRNKDAFID